MTLQWSEPSSWGIVCTPPENHYYVLYVSKDSGVGSDGTLKTSTGLLPDFIPNGKDVGTDTSYTVNGLVDGVTYYWQVEARNK